MEEGPHGLRSFLKDDPFAFGKGGEVLECLHAQDLPLPKHNH